MADCFRYAVSVDLAIDDMPRALKSKVKREALGDVLSVAMGGAKGLMINGSTRLVLALNHAHSTTRQLALARLSDVLGKEKVRNIARASNYTLHLSPQILYQLM